ncbi:hypothetical protein ACTTAF_15745 [Rhodobacter capsulatus]|uniref:hypothetical protein n=1 Tax=Rhodobacter capsulatus TaxID=1061 RepID=UPI0040385718
MSRSICRAAARSGGVADPVLAEGGREQGLLGRAVQKHGGPGAVARGVQGRHLFQGLVFTRQRRGFRRRRQGRAQPVQRQFRVGKAPAGEILRQRLHKRQGRLCCVQTADQIGGDRVFGGHGILGLARD